MEALIFHGHIGTQDQYLALPGEAPRQNAAPITLHTINAEDLLSCVDSYVVVPRISM